MGYTNSSLISYQRISPNRNSPRNHEIDRITPHCYVGQASVESMSEWLCNPNAQASSNYGIGNDGRIGLFVPEQDRSWCSSSSANDNRSITIECACNPVAPYEINTFVYNSLLQLMTDICKRNGKSKLIWIKDKNTALAYTPKSNEMLLTVHRWFANKECPGEYIYSRLGTIADEVTKRLNPETPKIITAALTPQGFIKKVSDITKKLYSDTHILPSVVIAQCCLETGFGLGADAQDSVSNNNLLGMKANLLNSTWKKYSVWPGKSFEKVTTEVYNGVLKYVTDSFRIYDSWEQCIKDYEMFLLNVKSENEYKYRKIIYMNSPKEVITAISKGGYATDLSYIDKVMAIIDKYDLTKYDKEVGAVKEETPIIEEVKTDEPGIKYRIQVGAFSNKDNALNKVRALKNKGIVSIIKNEDNMYKVQAGLFTVKVNAEKRLQEIKKAGFTDAFIVKI